MKVRVGVISAAMALCTALLLGALLSQLRGELAHPTPSRIYGDVATACTAVAQRGAVISATASQKWPDGDAGPNLLGGGTFNTNGQLNGRAYVTYYAPGTNAAGAYVKVLCDNGQQFTDGGIDGSYTLFPSQSVNCVIPGTFRGYALGSAAGLQLVATECVP